MGNRWAIETKSLLVFTSLAEVINGTQTQQPMQNLRRKPQQRRKQPFKASPWLYHL